MSPMPGSSQVAALRRVSVGWLTAGVLACAGIFAWQRLPAFSSGTFLVLIALVLLSQFVRLNFVWSSKHATAFAMEETGLAAALLLLPPPLAVVAGLAGLTLGQIARRNALIKVGFNVGQYGVSMAAAAAVMAALPAFGPLIDGRGAFSVLVAMTAYGIVNNLAIAHLLIPLADKPLLQTVRENGPIQAATIAGNVAIGIIAAGLYVERPVLMLFLVAPAAAVHVAYRNSVRADELVARLSSERDRLDRVVAGASDGIMLLDREGVIEVWNDAMTRLTGVEADDAVGSPVGEVLTEQVRRGDETVAGRWLLDAARPTRPRAVQESLLIHPDGGSHQVVESHTFLFDERGRTLGDVVLVRDVTRERELEAMKGDFISRVSHELRTPLTPIKGFARLLTTRYDRLSDDQRRTALEKISEQTEHMSDLVEDLLLATSFDGHDAPGGIAVQRLDAVHSVTTVVEQFRDRHPHREFHLWADRELEVIADPQRVQQVLRGLLDNAVRYTDDAPIEIEVAAEGDDVAIRVIDHGPGIPRDQHEAVFERFHRLEDPLHMRTSGVGLGLFLGRKMTEAMHGSLTIEPTGRRRAGAIFVLRLPSADPRGPATPAPNRDLERRDAS